MANRMGFASWRTRLAIAVGVGVMSHIAGAADEDTAVARAAGEGTGASSTEARTSLGARLDCLHNFNADKGTTQGCLSVTGLRLEVEHQRGANVRAELRIDPFATPAVARAQSPDRGALPRSEDTSLGVVDRFAVVWTPRPNLDIAVGTYEGTARLPNTTGFALANVFEDAGWKQSALTLTYRLAALQDMRVTLAVGDGEGEATRNLDPQQYFGFGISASVVSGVKLSLGASTDGNSVGSEEYTWNARRYRDLCGIDVAAQGAKLGWSTQRLGAALLLDGSLAGIEGLEGALGWQRNVLADLTGKQRSAPILADLDSCRQLPVDWLFLESSSPDKSNTVERSVWDVNLKYRLLGRYFMAFDYTTRRIDMGAVSPFAQCEGFVGTTCTVPADKAASELSQDAYTVGGGMHLADGLDLVLEYHRESFGKRYAGAYYANRDGRTAQMQESFNARIAYGWQ